MPNMSALRAALQRAVTGTGRFGRGAATYLGVTGGLGAGLGAGIGAGSEPSDRWAGARDGAVSGAQIGPVTIPAMASAAGGWLPVAGAGVVAHTLYSGDLPAQRERARTVSREADEFARLVRQQQAADFHRMMVARFGPDIARQITEQGEE